MKPHVARIAIAIGVVVCSFAFVRQAPQTAAAEDRTPPVVRSFSITPTEIDTSDSSQTLTLTLRVTDDLSGVCMIDDCDGQLFSPVQMRLASLIGTQFVDFMSDMQRVSGDDLDGVYVATATIPKYAKVGLWKVYSFVATDKVGNSRDYQANELAALPGSEGVTIANTSSSTSVEIESEWVFSSGDTRVTFPENTMVTRGDGGSFQMYRMVNQEHSLSGLTTSNKLGTKVKAIRLGIPGLDVEFSKDVEVAINVGDAYAGRTLLIQTLEEGGESWANESSCTVSGDTANPDHGRCIFTVDHASYFSVNALPIQSIITAPGAGGGPHIRTFSKNGTTPAATGSGYMAFNSAYRGGTHVASGDIDGDGVDEIIVGVGTGEEPWVRVFEKDGTPISAFLAYGRNIRGGVYVAAGDLDGNGRDEVITGVPEGYGPHVRVFDGRNGNVAITAGFFAYGENMRTGIRVAAGDLDGDGMDEIVTGTGYGAGTHVRTFTKTGEAIFTPGFFVYGESDRTGINVAVGDIDGNGKAEIITGSGQTREPEIKVYTRYGQQLSSFVPYGETYLGGVTVASGDIDGDDDDDIVTGTRQGGGPQVRAFTSNGVVLGSFFAYDAAFRGGVNVAAGSFAY